MIKMLDEQIVKALFVLPLVLFAQFGAPSLTVAKPRPDQWEACYSLLRQKTVSFPNEDSTRLEWLRGGLLKFGDIEDLDLDFSIYVGLPNPQQIAEGSALRIQKKPGRRWFSAYGVYPSDRQGDPRYPILFLGREVAAILGYFMPDENTVIYPSVARINFGIQLLNVLLAPEDQILLRFYEQDHGSSVGYIEHLIDFRIPISTDDVYLAVHDHVFHVPMLLAESAVLRRIQILGQEIGLNFSKKYAADTGDKSGQLRPLLESILNSAVAYPSALLMAGHQALSQNNNLIGDLGILFGRGDVGAFVNRVAELSQAPHQLKQYLQVQQIDFRDLSDRLNAHEGVGVGSALDSRKVMRSLLARRRVLREAAVHFINRPPQTEHLGDDETPSVRTVVAPDIKM